MVALGSLTMIAVSVAANYALSAGISKLLMPKQRSPVSDDIQPTEVSRGGWVRAVIGRHRLAPVIAYNTDPVERTAAEGFAGGKRNSTPDPPRQTTYEMSVVYIFALAPISMVHRLIINGKDFITAGMTPRSSPTGVVRKLDSIEQPELGGLRAYWDPSEGAVSPLIQAAGLNTRLPWGFRIELDTIDLGTSKALPSIEAEVSSMVITGLKGSPAWHQSTFFAQPDNRNEISYVSFVGGPIGVRHVVTADNGNDALGWWKVGGVVRLNGSAALNMFPGTGGQVFAFVYKVVADLPRGRKRVFIGPIAPKARLRGSLLRSVTGDIVERIDDDLNSGVNPGHMLYQLMFAPAPYGGGLDTSRFDMNSLENVAKVLYEEGHLADMRFDGGESIGDTVRTLMREYGIVRRWDVDRGLFAFSLIRESQPPHPELPASSLLSPLPEKLTNHTVDTANRWVFKYLDRQLNYKPNSPAVDDDGNATESAGVSNSQLTVVTTTRYETALDIANRLAGLDKSDATQRIHAQREGRLIIPGQVLAHEGESLVQRVVTVKREVRSPKVIIGTIRDAYSQPDFVDKATLPGSGDLPAVHGSDVVYPVPDADLIAVEPREGSQSGNSLMVLRVPGSENSRGATLWVSFDGTTYEKARDRIPPSWGGTLTQPLDELQTTVELQLVGDTALAAELALDLSGAAGAVSAGRQVAVVADPTGTTVEVLFVESVTLLGSDATLNNVVRARMGSDAGTWPAGSRIIVARARDVVPLRNLAFGPGAEVWLKSQPSNGSIAVGLGEITATRVDLLGTVEHHRQLASSDQIAVKSILVTVPPPSPEIGDTYLTLSPLAAPWDTPGLQTWNGASWFTWQPRKPGSVAFQEDQEVEATWNGSIWRLQVKAQDGTGMVFHGVEPSEEPKLVVACTWPGTATPMSASSPAVAVRTMLPTVGYSVSWTDHEGTGIPPVAFLVLNDEFGTNLFVHTVLFEPAPGATRSEAQVFEVAAVSQLNPGQRFSLSLVVRSWDYVSPTGQGIEFHGAIRTTHMQNG